MRRDKRSCQGNTILVLLSSIPRDKTNLGACLIIRKGAFVAFIGAYECRILERCFFARLVAHLKVLRCAEDTRSRRMDMREGMRRDLNLLSLALFVKSSKNSLEVKIRTSLPNVVSINKLGSRLERVVDKNTRRRLQVRSGKQQA